MTTIKKKTAQRIGTNSSISPAEIYEQAINGTWYTAFYTDLAEADADPVEHFRNHGANEGRNPNPFFKTSWYLDTYLKKRPSEVDALNHFLTEGVLLGYRPHPLVDLEFIRKDQALQSNLDAFLLIITRANTLDSTCEWFSRKFYEATNTDLAADGFEDHFLTHGCRENRLPSENFKVIDRAALLYQGVKASDVVDEYSWEHRHFYVVNARISASIAKQILEQGEFDPTVYAPGSKCIPYLPQFISDNLRQRDLFDYHALLRDFDNGPQVVLLLGRLGIGGAEKYAASLANVLATKLGLRVTVVTTDSSHEDNLSAKNISLLRDFTSVRVISFADHVKQNTWKRETILALTLMAVKPQFIFLLNSDLGLRTVEKHGAALSNISTIFAALFSQSPMAIGAPYSAVYLKQVIRHLNVLSDNNAALETFKLAIPKSFARKFVCVPQKLELPRRADFNRAIEMRANRKPNLRQVRCLWISRWEAFKATDVLVELATKNPHFLIDAYGPGQGEDVTPRPENLRNMGVAWNVDSIDCSIYDIFVFTSQFEGMPNIVLEMATKAIPIVASDVGGLKETFGRDTISLVNMADKVPTIAENFAIAINDCVMLSSAELQKHLVKCYEAVSKRHSPDAFRSNVERHLLSADHSK